MKAFVFTDERLSEHAGRFVWLEIDVEKAQNAAFRTQFPIRALPTYFVIEPESEQVLLRWVGGATVEQLLALLDDAEESFEGVRSSGEVAQGDDADALLARADRLYGQGENEPAALLYQQAIEKASPDWPSYARAVDGLLIAWSIEGKCEEAVRFARDAYPRLEGTVSAAVVTSVGLDCALSLPEDAPDRAELIDFFETAALETARDRSIPIPADDRSGVYISLYSARQAADDSTGARAMATEWAAFLEEAAGQATTPEERTVFDSHRLAAYLRLDEPERALPMLEQSQKDLPEDYNPAARLAIAYREMGRLEDALVSAERAADLAYGPRRLSILQTRASIQLAMADTAAARASLQEALEGAEALPEGQRSERRTETIRSQLGELSGGE